MCLKCANKYYKKFYNIYDETKRIGIGSEQIFPPGQYIKLIKCHIYCM